MFDIEEEVLKHPGIYEAEVIKFNINNEEYPAIVVVLKQEWKDRISEVLKYISNIKVPGSEYLLGTRFIDKFKTNPITSKRDYLSLTEDKDGYYRYYGGNNMLCQINIDSTRCNITAITEDELRIHSFDSPKVLVKK